MDLEKYLETIDWCSFWNSQLTSLPLFLLGLILSIWLIPKITISKIKVDNKEYSKRKINFVITSLCEVINRITREYEIQGIGISICSKTSDKEVKKFVAILQPNILVSPTKELFDVNFLTKLQNSEPEDKYVRLTKEIKRLEYFLTRLEKVVGFHSLHLEDKIIQEIGVLCLDIIDLKKTFEENKIFEELNTKRTFVYGISELLNVYRKIIKLLDIVIKEKHLIIENTNTNNG
ncbi:hypothetical protein KDU71_12685 [Carboxylicivirga sediminis]|uniref:Uncharacterized protein n=1 Tax=Carboxylicivirga sediminis TaxID=2006564 RepID=A0A941F450_9BACT|nr:hypothetical protein [Carboxylicivirga sediminis]MBR8536421.1 hypothetical protein [Carboxylicivirga sediminis]